LEVECSKGTYIRSLVKDIAQNLGTIATVKQLRRISSGKLHIQQAVSLEAVNQVPIITLTELKNYN
jgi:tRNA pseudouridine55 synthase